MTILARILNRTMMKSALVFGTLIAAAYGFVHKNIRNTFTVKHKLKQRMSGPSRTSLSMFLDDVDPHTTVSSLSNIFTDSPTYAPSFVPVTKADNDFSSSLLSDSSLVEAELLNGLAHVALDFSTLWGAATLALRLATVVGRVCVVASDFAPDKEILPDELAFQLGLLFIAFNALVNSALPKIRAALSPPLLTSKDRRAFRDLFRPAGISWHQYRELNLNAMDWVTVEPGMVITSDEQTNDHGEDDAVYWLYQGDVHIHSNNKFVRNVSRLKGTAKDYHHVAGLGLFGEMRLAHLLDQNSRPKHNSKKSTNSEVEASCNKYTVVAGQAGATLLRMNTNKLDKILKHDQDLTNSVNRLVFKGMQDKLHALLWKEA